jgi:hypothetical protein
MRRCFGFFVLALVTAAWVRNAVAAVTVFPAGDCPSSDAIAAHLQRVGALDLLSQLGAAEVRVADPSLHIHFRDRRGDALGDRTVTAPTDCEARAALAAAVIAAFAGEWAQTALAPPAAGTAVKAESRTPAGHPWQGELGAAGFAVHDGDEPGFGLGVRGDLGRGAFLVGAQFEVSSERERPLGSGRGGYRFMRAGLGLGIRKPWSRVFWDATLLSMVDHLSMAGKDLETNYTATSWGFAVAGQTRFGWTSWRLRPFLFAQASYRVPGQRMTLLDRPEVKVPLSAVNLEGGLGISFGLLP